MISEHTIRRTLYIVWNVEAEHLLEHLCCRSYLGKTSPKGLDSQSLAKNYVVQMAVSICRKQLRNNDT